MQIKKYIAANIKDATEQMRKELGQEAIILHTRKLQKGGLLKSVGGEKVEITAAIDDHPLHKSADHFPQTYSRKTVRNNFAVMVHEPSGEEEVDTANVLESLKRMSGSFEKRISDDEEEKPMKQSVKDMSEIVQLKAEVEDVKSMLQTLTQQLQYKHFGEMPSSVKDAYVTLLQQDMDEKIVLAITNTIMKKLTGGDRIPNKINVEQMVLNLLADQLPVSAPQKGNTKKPKVIALVGPTGVGKTTTIAKLAATEKLAHGKNVALISCDTYRIGAIEQLKTFAVIADIPMQVVYRTTDLAAAIKKFHRYDVIFIDTVGRSQKAKKDLQELKKIVQASKADEVHLVLSGQTNNATLTDIVERYQIVDPTHLLFSKLDEAAIFGPLYNIAQKTRIPVSYFTLGQAVPDDICNADGIKFAAMLYQGTVTYA
jgi:flagellar biosynthesis protein FlhF